MNPNFIKKVVSSLGLVADGTIIKEAYTGKEVDPKHRGIQTLVGLYPLTCGSITKMGLEELTPLIKHFYGENTVVKGIVVSDIKDPENNHKALKFTPPNGKPTVVDLWEGMIKAGNPIFYDEKDWIAKTHKMLQTEKASVVKIFITEE